MVWLCTAFLGGILAVTIGFSPALDARPKSLRAPNYANKNSTPKKIKPHEFQQPRSRRSDPQCDSGHHRRAHTYPSYLPLYGFNDVRPAYAEDLQAGTVVESLPYGCEEIWSDEGDYYLCHGVRYVEIDDGFVVIK